MDLLYEDLSIGAWDLSSLLKNDLTNKVIKLRLMISRVPNGGIDLLDDFCLEVSSQVSIATC